MHYPVAFAGCGYWRQVMGFVLAMTLFFALAEIYLRAWPPADLHQFLGEDSPLSGPFTPCTETGLAYRSYDAFEQDYRQSLVEFGPLDSSVDPRPIWALFGNSFVQAAGMLGDHVRREVPRKRVFYLRRNEILLVQLAQIELLLANGLHPERIFMTLMPVDIQSIGPQPLDTVLVNSRGGLTYRPRQSGLMPLDWLISNLRIATTAWLRSGRGVGNPGFNKRALYEYIHPRTLADLHGLFGHLAHVAGSHDVPVTIILIPTWEQVVGRKSYSFQDTIGHLAGGLGLDVLDPREAFHSVDRVERPGLYIPDKHLSEEGNQLLLQELLRHMEAVGGRQALLLECPEP
jgi:hypothetical protein